MKFLEDCGLLDPPAPNDATTPSEVCRRPVGAPPTPPALNDATTPSEEYRRPVEAPPTPPALNDVTTPSEEHRRQVGMVGCESIDHGIELVPSWAEW